VLVLGCGWVEPARSVRIVRVTVIASRRSLTPPGARQRDRCAGADVVCQWQIASGRDHDDRTRLLVPARRGTTAG
jgi:hypothetical protein